MENQLIDYLREHGVHAWSPARGEIIAVRHYVRSGVFACLTTTLAANLDAINSYLGY